LKIKSYPAQLYLNTNKHFAYSSRFQFFYFLIIPFLKYTSQKNLITFTNLNNLPMQILLFLLIIELLTLLVLYQHYSLRSRRYFFAISIVNLMFSVYSWYLFIRISFYKGILDDPRSVLLNMNFIGIFIAVWVPRSITVLLHFTGKLINIRKKRYVRSYTNTGLCAGLVIFLIIAGGNLFGRFNYSVEKVNIGIPDLPEDLNGLTIVQISDIHLGSYKGNYDKLRKVVKIVNGFKPDIIFNTGDFVSFGWHEFAGADTIFKRMKSRYGNFAILGNHDIGTYIPDYTPKEIEANIIKMKELIRSSGYIVLDDENTILQIGKTKLAIAGVETRGRHPDIIHGNLTKAIAGLDSTEFKILLSHDPNHWYKAVTGKTDIDLTLSGHTHGMQVGIITPWFKWSPSKYFYPQWNGLFWEANQFLYVNRGLGLMEIPFRICMPPEITIMKLISVKQNDAK
jgi:predicted MPP superfamily phosphohydrolase